MGAAPKLKPPSVELDVPDWPRQLAERDHNKIAREALTDELAKHYRKRVPLHFKATARTKYGYAQRSAGYKRTKLKKYGGRTDLVKTGLTEQTFTKGPPKIVISGSATSMRGFGGRLVLGKFPFMVAYAAAKGISRYRPQRFQPKSALLRSLWALRKKPKTGVNLDQMRKEITCITPDEGREIATGFLAGYWQRVKQLMAQGKRRRYGNRRP